MVKSDDRKGERVVYIVTNRNGKMGSHDTRACRTFQLKYRSAVLFNASMSCDSSTVSLNRSDALFFYTVWQGPVWPSLIVLSPDRTTSQYTHLYEQWEGW